MMMMMMMMMDDDDDDGQSGPCSYLVLVLVLGTKICLSISPRI